MIKSADYFDHQWYAWQHPNWIIKYSSPFEHFISEGIDRYYSPSPFVDLHYYCKSEGIDDPRNGYRDLLAKKGIGSRPGVYESAEDLKYYQRKFRQKYRPTLIKKSNCQRPYLLFIQCKDDLKGKLAAKNLNRSYDILLSYYSAKEISVDFAEHVVYQVGTKFSSMYNIAEEFPCIFSGYSYILFLDDDIAFSPDGLDLLFDSCRSYGLHCAQASLSLGSDCAWPSLYVDSLKSVRYLNATEIMMPVFSRDAFSRIYPYYVESISGFGLDFLAGDVVRKEYGQKSVGIVDDVVFVHEKAIDQVGGSYYEFLKSNNILPHAELWKIICKYNVTPYIAEVSCD